MPATSPPPAHQGVINRPHRLPHPYVLNVLGCLLLMAVAGNISVYLGQDASFDLKNYHWYNAYAFLNDRLDYDIAPAMLQSYLNPLIELPYFLVATTFPDYPAYAVFLQGSYYGLLVFLIIKLALHLFPETPANLLPRLAVAENQHGLRIQSSIPKGTLRLMAMVAVGATGAATLSQFGSTSNEMQVSVLIVAGLYALITGLGARHPTRNAVIAGCLFGAATGLKLTAAPYAIGAVAAFAIVCQQRKSLLALYVPFLLALSAVFMLLQGTWSTRLYQSYGNPLFPFYNHVFASEWWEAKPLVTAHFFPRDVLQWLFYPLYWVKQNYYLVMDGAFRDARIAISFLAVIAMTPGAWRGPRAAVAERRPWQLLTVFFLVSYLAWLVTFSTYRYLIPLEALSGILLVGALHRIGIGKYPLSFLVLAAAAILSWSRYPDYGHTAISPGLITAEAPVVPPDALIILLGDAPMSYVAPSFPKDARFIGIGNNFLNPGMRNRLQQSIDRTIANHRGAIFIIDSRQADAALHTAYLSLYGLTRSNCIPMPTSLDPSGLSFCHADRRRIERG